MNRLLIAALLAASLSISASGQEIKANDEGQLRNVGRVFTNDAGVLREVQEIYVNDNGALRLVFVAETVTLSGTTSEPNMLTATASPGASKTWTFGSDGIVYAGGAAFDAGTEWLDSQPNPKGAYWIRGTLNADTAPISGPTLGSWFQVTGTGGSSRTWTWATGGGALSGSIRIDIARDSDGDDIVASGYYGAEFE